MIWTGFRYCTSGLTLYDPDRFWMCKYVGGMNRGPRRGASGLSLAGTSPFLRDHVLSQTKLTYSTTCAFHSSWHHGRGLFLDSGRLSHTSACCFTCRLSACACQFTGSRPDASMFELTEFVHLAWNALQSLGMTSDVF